MRLRFKLMVLMCTCVLSALGACASALDTTGTEAAATRQAAVDRCVEACTVEAICGETRVADCPTVCHEHLDPMPGACVDVAEAWYACLIDAPVFCTGRGSTHGPACDPEYVQFVACLIRTDG